jgi:hypothetical protein
MRARGLVLVVLVVLGVLGLGGVALAAAPEAPVSEAATGVTLTEAVLHGELSPGAVGKAGWYFAYNTGSSCTGGGRTGLEGEVEGQGVSVQSAVSGLDPGALYTFCLFAVNEAGEETEGSALSFETPTAAPTVSVGEASEVDSASVTLGAQVTANGVATGYHVEYGTSEAYRSSSPEASLGTPAEPVGVQVHLQGLTPGTLYHYRFVVSNERGTGHDVDATFTTATVAPVAAAAVGLPDGRVYEMVTPPSDENAEVHTPEVSDGFPGEVGVQTSSLFQVAVDGDAVAYQGDATPSEGGVGVGGSGAGSQQYLARRSPGGGWVQVSIQPPGNKGADYQGFSSDLAPGILGTTGRQGGTVFGGALSPEALPGGYSDLYSRMLDEGVYRPLFTKAPPYRAEEQFEASEVTLPAGANHGIVFAGGSADFGQLLFEADDALLDGAGSLEKELGEDVKREMGEGKSGNYLYDSVGGQLSLVDVLPDGSVAPDATFGSLTAGNRRRQVKQIPDFGHVISGDGRRVYWTALNTGIVYVREDGVSTVPVSVGSARFLTATGNGRYAFYTEGDALYRFDAENPQARETLAAPGMGVEGVLGASEDGEDVYFVASGVLAAGATPGQPNLYLVHAGGAAAVTFIATLSSEDGSLVGPWGKPGGALSVPLIGDLVPAVGLHTAEVAPGGSALVFMSSQSLKAEGFPQGYANQGQDEVYVYDPGSGKLFCVSCDRSGGVGSSSGYLPVSFGLVYQVQWMSDDGSRVFFDSPSALVPQDVNGRQDVYEWEREGTGSCGAGAVGGCVYLLSGGTGSSISALIGASADGTNVFFVTRAQLTPEDDNEEFDLYDARVGGVSPAPSVACSGVACPSAPVAAPGFATPSSATYNGGGNIAPPPVAKGVKVKAKQLTRAQKMAAALRLCKRVAKRARSGCVVRARRRYGSVGSAKRASRSATKGRR